MDVPTGSLVLSRCARRRIGRVVACIAVVASWTTVLRGSEYAGGGVIEPPVHLQDGTASVMVDGFVVDGDGVVATDGEPTSLDGIGMESAPYECPTCPDCPQGGHCRHGRHGIGLINRMLGPAQPRWVVQTDLLMLWQGNIPGRSLFSDVGTQQTVIGMDDLTPTMALAPRIGLFLNVDACHTLEANYFIVEGFSGSAELPLGETQYAMDNLAGLTYADIDSAFASSQAEFKSFELNWRRRANPTFTWLAGFRWVEWDENLRIVDTFTDEVFAQGIDVVDVGTGNNLYGGQIGLDAVLWEAFGRIRFDGVAKAGIFYNHACYQDTAVRGDRAFGDYAGQADQTAFVGEVGVYGSVRLTSWLSWRAGYNFFWLSGLALSGDQLDEVDQAEPTRGIDTNGSVLVQGVNTGLEARW